MREKGDTHRYGWSRANEIQRDRKERDVRDANMWRAIMQVRLKKKERKKPYQRVAKVLAEFQQDRPE